jgi:ATP-dependent Clp protease protease subunit
MTPSVFEQMPNGTIVQWDVFSRLMKDRIIFLGTEVDDYMGNMIIAQLLFLQMDDPKKDIHLYINSPGGSITAGLAIYDTIQFLTCDVNTYCIGMAASMGAVLLCAGTKGKRYALPNSDIMIHQASGGARGTAADVERTVEFLYKLNRRTKRIIAHHTGQPEEKVNRDCDRDYFMTAQEAKDYGLVDEVVTSRKDIPNFAELTKMKGTDL